MITVPLKIVRFISDSQPGFVAGELVDAYGRVHTFEDKVGVITHIPHPLEQFTRSWILWNSSTWI